MQLMYSTVQLTGPPGNSFGESYSSAEKHSVYSVQRPNNHWCDITGRMVETLPNHQYWIRIDGSGRTTLWNRRFLKKIQTPAVPTPIPIAFSEPPKPTFHDAPQTKRIVTTSLRKLASPSVTPTPKPMPTKVPRVLSRLLPCNRPGRKELISPQRLLCPRVVGRGRGDVDWTSYLPSQEGCDKRPVTRQKKNRV